MRKLSWYLPPRHCRQDLCEISSETTPSPRIPIWFPAFKKHCRHALLCETAAGNESLPFCTLALRRIFIIVTSNVSSCPSKRISQKSELWGPHHQQLDPLLESLLSIKATILQHHLGGASRVSRMHPTRLLRNILFGVFSSFRTLRRGPKRRFKGQLKISLTKGRIETWKTVVA